MRPVPLLLLLLLALGACHAVTPARTRVVARNDIAPDVRRESDRLFAAVDGADVVAVEALLHPGFTMFNNLRQFDGADLLGRLRARVARRPLPTTRTCSEVSVHRAGRVAVYIGDCVEHVPADGEVPAHERDGWNTLVWTWDPDGRWRLAHWGWKPGGLAAERAMWDDIYRDGVGFKHTANQLLVDTARTLRPGTALDLMTGQGRNALYLGAHGWKVTGIDISSEGIAAAADAARRSNVELTLLVEDVDRYDLGVERWDLVTMIYAGSDRALIAKAQRATAPNGTFVVEFFLKEGGPMGFDPGELAAQFTGWTILVDQVVEDVADWSLQRTTLVRFVARKPTAPAAATAPAAR